MERPEYLSAQSAHYTLSSPCLPFIHFDPDSSGGGHLFVFQNVPKGLCEVFCWGMDAAPEQKWSCMLVDWSLHIEVAFELHLKVLPCAAILSPKTAQRWRCKSAEKLHTEDHRSIRKYTTGLGCLLSVSSWFAIYSPHDHPLASIDITRCAISVIFKPNKRIHFKWLDEHDLIWLDENWSTPVTWFPLTNKAE